MYVVSMVIILPYLDIPLVRVLDIIQAHVVAEPPVVLLAVEDVPNLPGELGPLPLVNDPEVRIGVARPGAALRLSIALEEVSNTLGVAVLKTLQHINMVHCHLCLGLPLHDHYLPWQVPDDAGL